MSAICIAMFLAYSGLRIFHSSTVPEIRQFPDTQGYMEKANWPLWAWGGRTGPLHGTLDWWLHGRSLTAPLFFKLAGSRPHGIRSLQVALSIFSWGLPALFILRSIEFNWLKPIAFVIVLFFSLSDQIIMWDTVVLSDSISVSLMALLVASGLWLLESWRWQKAALLLAVAILWTFTRDSNAWVILMLAILLLIVEIPSRSTRYLSVAAILGFFFIANEVSQNYSRRWIMPFFNVLGQRILPNADAINYFAQLGMPVTPALMERSGTYASDQNWAFYSDPALKAFEAGHTLGESQATSDSYFPIRSPL